MKVDSRLLSKKPLMIFFSIVQYLFGTAACCMGFVDDLFLESRTSLELLSVAFYRETPHGDSSHYSYESSK